MNRITYDPNKCNGCRTCEGICSFMKEGEFNPLKARGKVIRTIKDGGLQKVRVSCLQCETPYCMAVCPVRAINADEKNVKVVDVDKCIGCRMCETACPVGAIMVDPEKHVAFKCDLSHDLDEPQCVKYCLSKAVQYMPEEKIGRSKAREKSDKYLELLGESGKKSVSLEAATQQYGLK